MIPGNARCVVNLDLLECRPSNSWRKTTHAIKVICFTSCPFIQNVSVSISVDCRPDSWVTHLDQHKALTAHGFASLESGMLLTESEMFLASFHGVTHKAAFLLTALHIFKGNQHTSLSPFFWSSDRYSPES